MKYIIDIPEHIRWNAKNNLLLGGDLPSLNKIIGNGTPYNDTGDLISREALKKDLNRPFIEDWEYKAICNIIDNAPTVDITEDKIKLAEELGQEMADDLEFAYNNGYKQGQIDARQEEEE